MDVNRLAEPQLTARVHAVMTRARETFTPWQALQVQLANENSAFVRGLVAAIQDDLDNTSRLRAHAAHHAKLRGREAPKTDAFDLLPGLFAHAKDKPLVTSALVWQAVGEHDREFAEHLLQVIRMAAGLPSIKRRLGDETMPPLPSRFDWLGDRLLADLGEWIENIPAPFGPDEHATLARQQAAIVAAREQAPRVSNEELAGFLQRTASFFVHVSQRANDPIGFPLAQQAELTTDPPLARRIELATWARRSGHRIALRGRMFVLAIGIAAPWPLRLELIATELGHSHCGGPALLLRLDAGGSIAVVSQAPAMLCLADDTVEERGRRFERWLVTAYPQAVQPWRAWS